MKKTGIIIVLIFVSVACSTTNIQPSSQANTPTIDPIDIPIPTITKTPITSPTASLPKLTPTAFSKKASYKIGIVLDPSLQSGDISIASAWLGYAAARAEWIQTNISAEEIVQKGYHRTFEEEASARSSLAKMWKEFGNSQANLKNPYLDDLLKVYEAGFIKEYTWIFLASNEWLQPEGLQLDEFSAWSNKNLSNHKPETRADIEITIKPISSSIIKLQDNDVFCPSKNEDAQKTYDNANSLKANGKFAEAERFYLKAIELDPSFCDAMDNLGQLLRQQNKIDEAINWYKKSLEIMPDNTVALQNLALAYDLQGNIEKALEEYGKLIEVAPENPEGYFGLGNIYFKLEQPEKAITYFETAENLYAQDSSPYLADAQYYLGFSHFMLQNCVDARKYLEPIYTQFSEDGGINYVLGVCYLKAESINVKVAREYILKAQELGIQIPADVWNAINGK